MNNGHQVFVICKEPRGLLPKSSWIDDVTIRKIKRIEIRESRIVTWLNSNGSIINRIKSRFAKIALRTFTKGTIYDRAIGCETKLQYHVRKVINEQKIKCVCITGAPFNLFYYTTALKKEFPDVKFLCDYRDPWLHAVNYGMSNLTDKQRKFEFYKQNCVFENADFVSAPNKFLLQEIRNGYTGKKGIYARFEELPHAYDPDDVVATNVEVTSANELKIVYAGTIYLHFEKYLFWKNTQPKCRRLGLAFNSS